VVPRAQTYPDAPLRWTSVRLGAFRDPVAPSTGLGGIQRSSRPAARFVPQTDGPASLTSTRYRPGSQSELAADMSPCSREALRRNRIDRRGPGAVRPD